MEECVRTQETMNPALCAENISKFEIENTGFDENSLPGITSLSERSTCSTDWSSTLLREGSERWDLDDDSSQSDTPTNTDERATEHLHTIFESVERVVDPANESTSELSDDGLMVAKIALSEAPVPVLPRKQVTWGLIEMRLHPIILGDHPDAWQGPPITIDWIHSAVLQQEIDDYEEKRKPRKLGMDLRLSWLDRRRMLLRLGVQEKDMQAAAENCYKVRVQREKTAAPWQVKLLRSEQGHESLFRKFTKSIFQKRPRNSAAK